ncbi:hypothetical protein NMY22_g802 [Coprinellus aureogranulatus]|nr:hypothetical protein NMY22_g802 [Coprinellus aureogranulatus]
MEQQEDGQTQTPMIWRRQGPGIDLEKANHQMASDLVSMKQKIQAFERSHKRQKTQLRMKAEQLKDAKTELEEARVQVVMLEEKMDKMEATERILVRGLQRYREWWLTEYYSLRALLGMIPDKADVEAIASSAHGRFMHYSAARRAGRD